MNGDWMLVVLEALAGEIEMLRYRAKNAEEENMKLRNEIRAMKDHIAQISGGEHDA